MKRHAFPPQNILVPTDLCPTALPALQFARILRKQFGGTIQVPLLAVPRLEMEDSSPEKGERS